MMIEGVDFIFEGVDFIGCMDFIFRNLFSCQHKFLRAQILVIPTFFNTSNLYSRCAAHNQSNW